MIASVIGFVVASTLVVLLPGPDTLVVLRAIVRGGRGVGARCTAGVLTGLSFWVTASALGLSALVHASATGYLVLRIAGACYLIAIGVQSLRSRRLGREPNEELAAHRMNLLGSGYRAGLATNLLNPKVGVFFISLLPSFVPHGHDPVPLIVLFGAIFVFETALYFAVMLTATERLLGWLRSPQARKRLDRATGLVLVGFGLRLAIER